jgi:hypothetical protein
MPDRQVERTIVIDTTPEMAFEAVTKASELREWMCDLATTDPKIGGRVYFAWHPGFYGCGDFTNLEPDLGAIMQPNNSGARCGIYQESNDSDVTVTATWSGDHSAGVGAPMVCVNPNDDDFGLAFVYEYELFGGTYVLWAMGRQPDDVRVVFAVNDPGHIDGAPIELAVRVSGSTVTCFADGGEILEDEVPLGLRASTMHGLAIDVNAAPGRSADLPVIVASSFAITAT